jgi:hypothetical protein
MTARGGKTHRFAHAHLPENELWLVARLRERGLVVENTYANRAHNNGGMDVPPKKANRAMEEYSMFIKDSINAAGVPRLHHMYAVFDDDFTVC